MKDYTLSEVKAICSVHPNCFKCCFNTGGDECMIMGFPYEYVIDNTNSSNGIKYLVDTIELMKSEDYKDRFKAEYYQLKIRYERLDAMVKNWDNLEFTPTCEKQVYRLQLAAMLDYLKVLEIRADIENIKLN